MYLKSRVRKPAKLNSKKGENLLRVSISRIKNKLGQFWRNLKFMRWLAIFSTIITVLLGTKDLVRIIGTKISENEINTLMAEIDELNGTDYKKIGKWSDKVKKFNNSIEFRDQYNFMKGCEMELKYNRTLSENVSPDYFFKRISSNSTIFNLVVINRFLWYLSIQDKQLRSKKQKQLLEDLKDMDYTYPVYYMYKARYDCASLEIDSILPSYENFKKNHNIRKDNDTIEVPYGTSLEINGNVLASIDAIDLYYTIAIYYCSKDKNTRDIMKKKIEYFINGNDDKLIWLRIGYTELGQEFPLLTDNWLLSAKQSKKNYIFYEREMLKRLIRGELIFK